MLIHSFSSFNLAVVGSSLTYVVNDLNSQSTNQTNFYPNYNEFVQEEKPVAGDEQLQPHEHGRVEIRQEISQLLDVEWTRRH